MANVTFETLNPNAPLFSELKSGNYTWWENIKKDRRLYIEIRKDNYINVYFEGGNVAKLEYRSKDNTIQTTTHSKYLHGKGDDYVECSLDKDLETIITNIRKYYSKTEDENKKGKENWSEKYIQSQYIIKYHSNYIDSEFAYKDDSLDIRIDLIECINGELRFVELKTIDDSRMLKRNDDNPEVVEQVKAYNKFIHKYEEEIIKYYDKIWTIKNDLGLIKNDLGLIIPKKRPSSLAKKPLLLIFNRWTKSTPRRNEHTYRMEEILRNKDIDYKITSEI